MILHGPSVPGFRDTFRKYIPRWLQNRPGQNVGYRFLYSMIYPLDYAVQAILEGITAAWPGAGTSTADGLIAQSRGLVQGEAETSAEFEARAIGWIDAYTQDESNTLEQLLRAIQAYLPLVSGARPAVTMVDRAGHWTVLSSAGVCTTTTAAWNWDGTSNPERAGIWSDFWLIVYPSPWAQAPSIVTRAGSPHNQGYSLGHLSMSFEVDQVVNLLSTWKGGHSTCRAIVWSYDPTLCLPGGGNNPDGTWGYASKISGGPSGTRLPARSPNARYWEPVTV
jgi:hypothetical protein